MLFSSITPPTVPVVLWFVASTAGLLLLCPYAIGILNRIIQATWSVRQPIVSVHGGERIPGPPFELSADQGRAKLLTAREDSVRWRDQYGSIYRIWNGPWPEIVLTTPKDVETFYSGKGQHSKTIRYTTGHLFGRVLSDAVGLINGSSWQKLRRTLDTFVSFHAAARLSPFLGQRAAEHVEKLGEYRKLPSGGTTRDDSLVINVVQAMQPYAFFSSAEIFYGALNSPQRRELWALGQDFLKLAGHIINEGMNRTPFTRWWYTVNGWRALWHFEQRWQTFNRTIAQEKKSTEKEAPIVQLWKDIEDGQVHEQAILATLTESIFANLDVSTYAVASCVLHLSDNQTVQEKLQDELDKHKSNLQDYIDRQDSYLHWCFLEGLRLEPIPAFSLPESYSEDKVLGGYLVPAGTSVTIDAHALNIFNPFWGDDKLQYRPDRFASMSPTQMRYNLSTFGYGTRKCLGRHIGGRMIRALLAHLFLRYNVSLHAESKTEEGSFKVDSKSFFALFDVNVSLVARN